MQFARAGYTDAEIQAALVAPTRQIRVRYELLGRDLQYKRDITTVSSGTITFDSGSAIMRTAAFEMRDEEIDYLSARVRPVFGLRMGDTWAEWPLGVFVLSSPERMAKAKTVSRTVEAYDLNQLLKTDGISTRLYYPAGTRYTDIVLNVLYGAGITRANIEGAEDTIAEAVEYAPGAYRLDVINELLAAINYTPIHPDANGTFIARKQRDIELSDIAYKYSTKQDSVIMGEAKEAVDYFDTPNRFIAYVSSPEVAPMRAVYENADPQSPLSTKNRQVVTEVIELRDISTQAELDAYVRRRAIEAEADLHGIDFATGLMPMHGYKDVYQFEHDVLGINEIYQETAWSMELRAGGKMRHKARRITE